MPDILPAVEGYNHRPVANGFIHINLRTLAGDSVYQLRLIYMYMI